MFATASEDSAIQLGKWASMLIVAVHVNVSFVTLIL